jgi:putative ABC transport system permease protein
VPGVEKVASADGMIGGQNWTNYLRARGNPDGQLVNFLSVGYDFLDALGIELTKGRSFSPEHPSDSADAIILNETAIRSLGINEPVLGKQIVWAEDADSTYYATIVGVVRDFHFTSLRTEIKPFAFVYTPSRVVEYVVKITDTDVNHTLAELEKVWTEATAGRPFDHYFLDDLVGRLYRFEHNFRRVFSVMTLLSMFVACLGLFGLSAFMAEMRTKEIGVRKVLGASIPNLVALLSNDFLKLVLLAFGVATPIAYFAMNRWLSDFAYRIEIGPEAFIFTAMLVLLVTMLTVGYQSVKTALADPVKSLRYE